jgi:asparagine N-glycosylation enzyme membrane subunit Stt3
VESVKPVQLVSLVLLIPLGLLSKMSKIKVIEKKTSTIPAIILFILTLVMVLYVRVLPSLQSKTDIPGMHGIFLTDPDSCYHARRILYVAQHNMKLPFYDPLVAHPYGDVPVWSPLYDWISALPSYIISRGSPSDVLVIRVAGIMNVLFGLLQVALIGLIIYKSLKSKILALLAALLIGMTKPAVTATNFDVIDHHGILLFLLALLLYVNYIMFADEKERVIDRHVLYNALTIAALFWTWPGSYIYIGIAVLTQLLYGFISRKFWLFNKIALLYAISSILVAPLAYMHLTLGGKALRFDYVSFFTVIGLLALGFLFWGLNSIFALRTDRKNIGTWLKLLVSGIGIIIIGFFSLEPLRDGIKYIEVQNRWFSSIMEMGSVFYTATVGLRVFTLDNIIVYFGYLIFFFHSF